MAAGKGPLIDYDVVIEHSFSRGKEKHAFRVSLLEIVSVFKNELGVLVLYAHALSAFLFLDCVAIRCVSP